jgi:hypothetical protein
VLPVAVVSRFAVTREYPGVLTFATFWLVASSAAVCAASPLPEILRRPRSDVISASNR